MLIRTISTVSSSLGTWPPGTVVDVHESTAKPLIERGHAELYEQPAVVLAPRRDAPEPLAEE